MPGSAVTQYFDATAGRPVREDLVFALEHVVPPRVAVDCGCGAGADIEYLLSQGFMVHGFDIEDEAIARCRARFEGVDAVKLSLASFGDYSFPDASLVVADASLFFCPEADFARVWNNIFDCLSDSGIFSGSFLGHEDTMAGPEYRRDDYWPEVSAFSEGEVRELFARYKILRFNEHRSSGVTPAGEPHDWHIYSVVAKKPVRAAG